MKAMFGIVSLLIALAVVAWVAVHQLHAVGRDLTATSLPAGQGAVASASPSASTATLPRQVDSLQRKSRDDAVRALQEGMERNERVDRAEQADH